MVALLRTATHRVLGARVVRRAGVIDAHADDGAGRGRNTDKLGIRVADAVLRTAGGTLRRLALDSGRLVGGAGDAAGGAGAAIGTAVHQVLVYHLRVLHKLGCHNHRYICKEC